MRLAVYTDYLYHRIDGEIHAERAFALFLAELAERIDELVLIGRLHPGGGNARYPLGDLELVALPYYASLAEPRGLLRALCRSAVRFWRALAGVDAVWLLGPHPLVFIFAALAVIRRRRVYLGVRQEFIDYISRRHPTRPVFRAAAVAMEYGFRAMARVFPVIVVGPKLAHSYRHSRSVCEIVLSVVPEAHIVSDEQASNGGDYAGELSILSVGRLDEEKNPLALADVLSQLNENGGRWELTVCGDGPMSDKLQARLLAAGQDGRFRLAGYVAHADLRELYLSSDMLLHISWTEGVPQVLFEAFAFGLPVVATDVGGVRGTAGDAALLVQPGDPAAAASAIRQLAADHELRGTLVARGLALARENTLEAQAGRVADFMGSTPEAAGLTRSE
jgi:glycosyltransferase involved in cell wall biosynthesis